VSPYESRRGAWTVSTDPARLDLGVIHSFLTTSYWAAGIPRETVRRSLEHSLCFGLYEGEAQIGMARVVTDRATFAYVADVFVLERHRGRGLGAFLMECVMAHPDLQGLRVWRLATRDAHGLYRRFGFGPPLRPETHMEILDVDVYARPRAASPSDAVVP
jgi:GNAT superfamily N-acetyltransferase